MPGTSGRDCLLCQEKALGVTHCPQQFVLFESRCLGKTPVLCARDPWT